MEIIADDKHQELKQVIHCGKMLYNKSTEVSNRAHIIVLIS